MTRRSSFVRWLAWAAVVLQLSAAPIASLSHDHCDETGCRAAAHDRSEETAGRCGHRCPFSSCRRAAEQSARHGADSTAAVAVKAGNGVLVSPCAACKFLAQCVAVAMPPPQSIALVGRCHVVRPTDRSPRPTSETVFLARGPPAGLQRLL